MTKTPPDIHQWARQHPPIALPGDLRKRLLAAMMQEEADCAADEALEQELRQQCYPVPLPTDVHQNLRPVLQQEKKHWCSAILWRYAGAAAAVLVLGGVALHSLPIQPPPAQEASVTQQRQQREAANEHQDTFILKSSDNKSRVVIRVLNSHPAQLTDDVI